VTFLFLARDSRLQERYCPTPSLLPQVQSSGFVGRCKFFPPCLFFRPTFDYLSPPPLNTDILSVGKFLMVILLSEPLSSAFFLPPLRLMTIRDPPASADLSMPVFRPPPLFSPALASLFDPWNCSFSHNRDLPRRPSPILFPFFPSPPSIKGAAFLLFSPTQTVDPPPQSLGKQNLNTFALL